MRGGVFHEWMVDVLEDAFQKWGLRTQRQVPSRKGRTTGYIDLLVSDGASRLLVVEIEMGQKRVQTDIRKRNDLGDNATLWIVTPTREMATVIQKHLRDLGVEENERLFVLPFGTAAKRVSTKDPFCIRAQVRRSEVGTKTKTLNTQRIG
jgi:hypothetical protein